MEKRKITIQNRKPFCHIDNASVTKPDIELKFEMYGALQLWLQNIIRYGNEMYQ